MHNFFWSIANFIITEIGRRILTVVMLLIVLIELTACSLTGKVGTDFGASIGRREHPRVIAAYGGIYRNKRIEALLDDIIAKLVAASSTSRQNYRVTVLDSPVVNAFALPGGYIYVTRGLLALANDSSEVAAVLAHEMAHVAENHAFARQQVAQRVRLARQTHRVKDLIVGDQQDQIALAGRQVSLASFSRQQEIEADRIGVRTMTIAGFDAFAAARFLTSMGRYARFRAANIAEDTNKPNFLSSHPATPNRIILVLDVARNITSPRDNSIDRERYLGAIDDMTFGDEPSEGFVRGRTYLHPRLGFSFELPRGYILENTTQALLAANKVGTAVRFDAVQLSRQKSLISYLKSGWVNGLIDTTIQTQTVNGLEAATAEAVAKGWQFRIAVVRLKGGVYRFIFANADAYADLKADVDQTIKSFRALPRKEVLRLKPLSLQIVKVRSGDTILNLTRRMRGVDRPRQLFLILNGLTESSELRSGMLVKIVTE